MESESWRDKWAKVVAKAWTDPEFKNTLVGDPKGTLQQNGLEVWDGFDVEVNEGATRPKFVLALPDKPKDVSDEQLEDTVVHSSKCCC